MGKLIVEVNGRFGNHLHQLMAGKSIAKDNNLDFYINSTNGHWAYENYLTTKIPTIDINKIKYNHIGIPPAIHHPLNIDSENTYLTSYFLNYKWHLHNRDFLLDWLQFSPKYIEQAKKTLEPLGEVCSVHVRRDDYVALDYYKVLPIEYYTKTFNQLGNLAYLICSDDIPWCKATFKDGNFHFSDQEFIVDFLMMTMTPYNIIANSSFSYWAAYFNRNTQVFYPYEWSLYFGSNSDQIDELCLPTWTKIYY